MTARDRELTQTATDAELPASALAWVFEGYRLLGVDLQRDASEVGLSPAALLDDPFKFVPRATYALLLQRALAQRPDFAIESGRRCPFGTFPLLDCTTGACPTLGAAIESLIRYSALVTRNGLFRFDGDALELVPDGSLPEWFRIASFEFGLHYTAARLDELIGGEAVRGIEVSWPAPTWAPAYPRPTRFGAPRAALLLNEQTFGLPSRRADPLVASLLARNAATVLEAMPTRPTLQAKVQEVVVRLLPRGLPGMNEVARELAASPRTLRRRLAEEGVTFERVRDAALAAIARERLRDRRQSIAEVAYLLGFSEVRAFHRAFRRWVGATPGEYQRTAPGSNALPPTRP